MNDFFSNLIARSFSDAPVIQPRLPSLFETAANEFSDERQSSTPALAVPETIPNTAPLEVVSKSPPPSGPVGNRIANASEGSAEEPPLRSNGPEQKIAPEIVQAQSSEERAPARELPVKTKRIIVPGDSIADGEKHEDYKTRASKSFSQQRSVQPRVRKVPSAVDQRSSTTPPIIRVTIGRVVVRAVHQPRPAPKPAKASPPKLSLEDYLHKPERGSP
jgi:hypothetical protein